MAKNKKVIKEQKKYQNLQERYEEMNGYLLDLIEEHRCTEEDLGPPFSMIVLFSFCLGYGRMSLNSYYRT